MCRNFINGTCDRGDQCKFGHSEPPTEPLEATKNKSECRQYKDGHCPRGDAYTMLHSEKPAVVSHAKEENDTDSDGWETESSDEALFY